MAAVFLLRACPVILCAAFAATALPLQAQSSTAPGIVSLDLLRHPIDGKVRKLLQGALSKMQSGNHEGAIGQLRDTLARYPDSAAYVHSLLGVEYVKTDRLQSAVESFEQASLLLPHDAATHYNLGLSLVCAGEYKRAQVEVRRALELDPKNVRIQDTLNALLHSSRRATE